MDDGRSNDFETIYRREGERLWRAVFAYARDAQIADDAVSEAFAQAIRRGDAIRDPSKWVWAVAFRIAKGDLADRRERAAAEPWPGSYDPPESSRDLLDALGRLSPRQRACIVLFHYSGYPVKEIASMLGSTSAAVRVHLSQGRKRLRTQLDVSDDV